MQALICEIIKYSSFHDAGGKLPISGYLLSF